MHENICINYTGSKKVISTPLFVSSCVLAGLLVQQGMLSTVCSTEKNMFRRKPLERRASALHV